MLIIEIMVIMQIINKNSRQKSVIFEFLKSFHIYFNNVKCMWEVFL